MVLMLCRNRVADFGKWKAVFDSNIAAARAAGLRLISLWREIEDPNNVFFLFEVESRERARAFTEAPAAREAGKVSGVMDGEIHFLEPEGGA